LVVLAATITPLLSPPNFQKGGVMAGQTNLVEAYEAGYLDIQETLELFAELIRTGAIWRQRLSVRKIADDLISARYLTPEGKITAKGQALLLDEGREGSPCDANPELKRRALWEASDDLRGGPFGIVPPEVVDEKPRPRPHGRV
jgi:hypothetical protein